MANDRENAWLNVLERQAGIRRALIVHGNVNDVCYSVNTQDYRPVMEVVLRRLKQKGFDEIVLWDRFSGVQNVSAEVQRQIAREAALGDAQQAPSGEKYDVGNQEPAEPQAPGGTPPSAEDFLATVYHHMLKPKRGRYAFVLDWTHYLFGDVSRPTEQERQWLLALCKALRNAPLPMDAANIDKPANLVVLACNKIGGVPPSVYQANPLVQEVVIPLPGRVEREQFVKRTLDRWSLRQTLSPGSSGFDDFIDALEGFCLRDLQQLIKLSRQVKGDPLTTDQLVNLYKYGEQSSPWEDLSRDKLAAIEEVLRRRVKGQDEAIQKVRNVIIRAYTGLSGLQHSRKQKMPKGVLFFVGPTGVGKTELAKALAEFLFGDEDACLRFDMSEFNHEHSDQRLVGAPPGYVGYEEGGQLTNAVKRRPFSVLLFDEIEKAHGRILDKFLQILEDGRLTDGKGETVYFSETVIVFTSNIGAAEVSISPDPEEAKAMFVEKVREHFSHTLGRPEILNRIGNNIVPFNFITNDDFLMQIARAKLEPLKQRLKEKYRIEDVVFDDEAKALRSLARAVDRANGGRGMLNEMVTRLHDPLADFLFEQETDASHYAGRTIRVGQAGASAQFFFRFE